MKNRDGFVDIGFEGPVLSRSQIRRRSGFSQRNDMIIDKIFIVAGRVGIKFAFRNFFSVLPGTGTLSQ